MEAEWAVGSMQLAYDPGTDRVVLMVKELEGPEGSQPQQAGPSGPGATGTATARVALTRDQAAGVIEHGKKLLRGGRPPCPLCGYPLGKDHSCPKTNGHRPPAM